MSGLMWCWGVGADGEGHVGRGCRDQRGAGARRSISDRARRLPSAVHGARGRRQEAGGRRWSSIWTCGHVDMCWRLEAGALGSGRHAACGRQAAVEGRRCFVAAMGRLDGHHRWRARSSSATLCRGCARVGGSRSIVDCSRSHGSSRPPATSAFPTSVSVLNPRSSLASWRPRNRDEIDELTMIDLHRGSRPKCPYHDPSPGGPAGFLFHTPTSHPAAHPAPDRLMEPAHAVYS
jgi:hypothetical protein